MFQPSQGRSLRCQAIAWCQLVAAIWSASSRRSVRRLRKISRRAYWRVLNGYGTLARGCQPKRYGWSWSPAPSPSSEPPGLFAACCRESVMRIELLLWSKVLALETSCHVPGRAYHMRLAAPPWLGPSAALTDWRIGTEKVCCGPPSQLSALVA